MHIQEFLNFSFSFWTQACLSLKAFITWWDRRKMKFETLFFSSYHRHQYQAQTLPGNFLGLALGPAMGTQEFQPSSRQDTMMNSGTVSHCRKHVKPPWSVFLYDVSRITCTPLSLESKATDKKAETLHIQNHFTQLRQNSVSSLPSLNTNALQSSTRLLPSEILSLIFQHACSSTSVDFFDQSVSSNVPWDPNFHLTLGFVSVHWHQVVVIRLCQR